MFDSFPFLRRSSRRLAALTVVLGIFGWLGVPPQAQAQVAASVGGSELIQFPVEKYQLKNGLTVLLHQDRSVPIISYHTWFRVGSKDEEKGLTGLAHLFEHMMFKGAKRYSGDDFDRILQMNGAINNAFTSHDYTGYYENLPSSRLELVIDIESDRMQNLVVDQKNLDSEREVVREERRYRVDNNPTGILFEEVFRTAFQVAQYRWPVIGSMEDLTNVTPENATRFYRTFYAPNNAVVVLAGDFEVDQAKRLIERYYGGIPSQPLPNRVFTPEPPQTAPRAQRLTKEVQSGYLALAYVVPEAGSDDAFALDLLATILGQGRSSRLYQRLVHREQSALFVSASNMSLQKSGLFYIFAGAKPGVSINRIEESIRRSLWYPQNQNVTEAELQAAKNQTIKAYVDGLKTIHGRAQSLAHNEVIFGDHRNLFRDLDRYQKVTIADVRRVAQTHLKKERSNLVVLTGARKPARQGQGGGQ
jgi:zinc protease